MKRVFFITIVMCFTTFNDCYTQQNKMKIEDIKEIWVYDYFSSIGHTRGSIYRKFQELENNKTPKIRLDDIFTDSLKRVLIKSAKNKKLLPSKCGINLIFAQFILNNDSIINTIIASNGVFDYFVGNTGYFFIDTSNMRNRDMWINNFLTKLLIKLMLKKVKDSFIRDFDECE